MTVTRLVRSMGRPPIPVYTVYDDGERVILRDSSGTDVYNGTFKLLQLLVDKGYAE